MAYRPYPNADRALRQLDRHEPRVQPRQLSEFEQRLAQQANAALAAANAAIRPFFNGFTGAAQRAAARPTPGTVAMHKLLEGVRRPA